MKKLIILSAIAMSGLIYNTANAQIRIHVGLGFAPSRVVYAPAPVIEQAPVYQQPAYYQNNDDYYYLPDVDAYYSVNEQCYYYYDGDNWISAAYLPDEYRDYDWRSVRRYEVRAPRPYLHDDIYRSRYNGHEIQEWAHNNHNEHFDRNNANLVYRGNEQHFYNRGQNNYNQRFDNRGQGGYNQHSDNRGQGQLTQPNRSYGDYNQHSDNRGQGSYNQPMQPNRGQGGYNQHSDNRGKGDNNQPSNQNRGDFRNTRGNSEHFSQNNPKGGFESHRMARF
jgi:hypothetical protein